MERFDQDRTRTVDEYAMALKAGHLEWKYEKSLMLSVRILDAERSRAKYTNQLRLEFENDDLRSQLNQANVELSQGTKAARQLRIHLHDASKEVDRLQTIIKAPSHTFDGSHKEMASLRKAAAHSEKLAAENISLSEKVLSLRSELARRGTQSTSVEDLHAGRDGLQQQLETLRGDLESEKTACERIRAKELQQAGEISDLTMHLEEMRKQISEQLEARSREERYAKQQSLEWERQRTALEEKIGLLHQKPRPTKDQSQETKNNVREGNPKANDNDRRRPQSRSVPAQHQTPARFNSDMAIGTPGAVQPNGRHKRAAALPGDKSAFSITPFLNRTSAKRNSPSSSEEDSDELHAAGEERRSSDRGGIAASKRLRNATLSEDLLENPSKQRLNAHVSISSGIPANTHPDALSDHSDGGEQGEDLGVLQDQPIAGLSLARAKKRKLGVQRGSDEFEDIGSTKNPERTPALGVGRKPAMSGLQQPNIPGNSRPVRLPRSRVFSGLAGFSPLKRDRK